MANSSYPQWAPGLLNAEFTHKASEETDIMDLLWYDVANHCVRSAGQFADAGTAAPTQENFAALFAGVSNSFQRSTDATARNARIVIDEIFEFPCASSTFSVGDYVTPTYTTGVLSNQQLTRTTDKTLAIGRVVKEYQSATTVVKVRLTSSLLAGKLVIQPEPATPIILVAADGAIPPHDGHTYVVTKGSAAALTLAAPTAGTDDGLIIKITSATAFAHVLTATSLLNTGAAGVSVATFAAHAGAGLILMAYNGLWNVMSSVGITYT